jgi:hypothetical protein
VDLRNSEQLLRVVFSTFCGQKKKYLKKYFSIRIEKLHKMAFIYIFFYKFEKIEKIRYHSNFNFECNTEKGFKESLSIALGLRLFFKSELIIFSIMNNLYLQL